MSSLHIYDTLSQKPTEFAPRHPGEARVYTCGPTTYDVAHVGHGRAALAPDILVRHLMNKGFRVTYCRNMTDVDDKILKRASETGEQPTALSARMGHLYQADIATLGCIVPTVEPKVSESIADIIAFVEQLIVRNHAYVVDMSNGARDVYFAVRSFSGYGKLSKRNVEELRVGARIEASEDKRDPLDFALWKGCVGEAWGWDSPWGKGRPGWHIECSAMSNRYLGYGFDIHCGGMDLIFPHHENEIAQSEAAYPECAPLASIWMHNGFVNVDKEKMAKSLGNFVTLRDVYDRNDPEALRYFLLTVHYRGPITFETEKLENGRVVFPGVVEAERRVDYLYTTLDRLKLLYQDTQTAAQPAKAKLPKDFASFAALASSANDKITAALDDDLNTPVALSIIAELAKTANELADIAQKRRKDADVTRTAPSLAYELYTALRASLDAVGLLQTPSGTYQARTQTQRLALRGMTPEAIEQKLAERTEARKNKDFARGDAIRKGLEQDGIEVSDSPTGTIWRVSV